MKLKELMAGVFAAVAMGASATEQYTFGDHYIEFNEDIGTIVFTTDFGSVGNGGGLGWIVATDMSKAEMSAAAAAKAKDSKALVWKGSAGNYLQISGIAKGTRIAFYEVKNGQGFLDVGLFGDNGEYLQFSKKGGKSGGGDEKLTFGVSYVAVSPTPITPGSTPSTSAVIKTLDDLPPLPSPEESGTGGDTPGSGPVSGQPLPGAVAVLLLAGGVGAFAKFRRRKAS